MYSRCVLQPVHMCVCVTFCRKTWQVWSKELPNQLPNPLLLLMTQSLRWLLQFVLSSVALHLQYNFYATGCVFDMPRNHAILYCSKLCAYRKDVRMYDCGSLSSDCVQGSCKGASTEVRYPSSHPWLEEEAGERDWQGSVLYVCVCVSMYMYNVRNAYVCVIIIWMIFV